MLPQHARFCLPLEAGSGLGYIVYPALADHESFAIRRVGPGELHFSFFGGDPTAPGRLFSFRYSIPGGGAGVWTEDLVYRAPDGDLSDDEIAVRRDAVLRMASLWAPAGAVALRGQCDFRTPAGWDTVFTGMLNQASPPHLFAFTARVETDWYAFETEFRYVLQVGDLLSGSGTMPVGQVFLVPRDEITIEAADAMAVEEFRAQQARTVAEKLAHRRATATGLEYDVYYREKSRGRG